MTAITTIHVKIATGNNGTMGAVYLGLGGREFRLNRIGHNDFQRNSISQFVLGDASHAYAVSHPDDNDPTSPMPLDTIDLARFPVYIRLAGANGHWEIVGGVVDVHAGPTMHTFDLMERASMVLLGPDSGEYLVLSI
ncbi:hypothetical protein [Paraliomyxa miuraensis]|uniref:hypothetical protein n=1 Tax=Paraliomyxa miuraensis TaxID=376150 RepID=UPI00224CC858|nr:hypothetical protein [Paraliomyxa miuraensis]MCX4242168.1 hypothetical protein [Paraliomyxa miuraensis]